MAERLQDWIGRAREAEDILTPRLALSFQATLAPHLAASGEGFAPPGIHWCLAPEIVEASKLADEGHAERGDFLPPVPLPRRMWAGGDVRFHAPLRIGDKVRRRSIVSAIDEKRGKTGALCFVTVRHEFENERGPVLSEDQTIVYREAASALQPAISAQPEPALPPAIHRREADIDNVLLFRYSALTFNGHRIHYDAPYAMGHEHYAGIVIHGPLQATLLLNFAAIIGGRAPRSFSFRGLRPATGAQRMRLGATPDDSGALSLHAASATVTMTGQAQF